MSTTRKLLILIMLLGLICLAFGCVSHEPNGEIINIEKFASETVVTVRFKAGDGLYRDYEFDGSDTCKVGQIVRLQ